MEREREREREREKEREGERESFNQIKSGYFTQQIILTHSFYPLSLKTLYYVSVKIIIKTNIGTLLNNWKRCKTWT